MAKMSRIQAVKKYFGTDKMPVTNKELIEFKRGDAKGFEEVADEVMKEYK